MSCHYPKFYYSGSRRHGLASDLNFIMNLINFIPVGARQAVSEEYENIYRYHFNRKEYREARYHANKFLQSVTKDLVKNASPEERKENEHNAQWIRERINKVRAAQKATRKTIF